MRTRLVTLFTVLALLPFAACDDPGGGGGGPGGGDGGDSQALCSQAQAHLEGCGVLTEGEVNCPTATDTERCELGCLKDASCDEAATFFCTQQAGTVSQCYEDCVEQHGFSCADGSGHIRSSWRCDGEEDCADGSDEQGCAGSNTFACADGSQEIATAWVCDSQDDCADGSDEAAAAGCQHFTCDDGTTLPADFRCDFATDCADGSDEAGCAPLNCGS